LVSLTGRVLVGASVLAGVQWMVRVYPGVHWLVRVAALGLLALFASYTHADAGADGHHRGHAAGWSAMTTPENPQQSAELVPTMPA
jgi:hypothetical protein